MKKGSSNLRRLSVSVCSVGMLSLLMTGCATDAQTTQAEGTGIGALLGAGIGAVIGNQTGHAGQGALIGAALGGAGGYAYGTSVAVKKAKYKSTEEWLDASIADAQKHLNNAAKYNQKLDGRIAQLQSEIREAKAANDHAKLASLKRTIESEKAEAVKTSGQYNQFVQAQRTEINSSGSESSSKMKQLQSTTSQVQNEVSGMNRRVERYASLESQIDI